MQSIFSSNVYKDKSELKINGLPVFKGAELRDFHKKMLYSENKKKRLTLFQNMMECFLFTDYEHEKINFIECLF